jgi:hypothetical protein
VTLFEVLLVIAKPSRSFLHTELRLNVTTGIPPPSDLPRHGGLIEPHDHGYAPPKTCRVKHSTQMFDCISIGRAQVRGTYDHAKDYRRRSYRALPCRVLAW